MEFIHAAIRAGSDGIGLRLYPSTGMTDYFPIVGTPTLTREVKGALAGSGVKVYEMLTCYLQPDMDFEGVERSMELAGELGADYVLVIGNDPEWSRQVASLARLCDMSGRYGLTAAIETPVNRRAVNTLSKSLRLIDESGRPNAATCIDPVQFWRAGHTPDMIATENPRLFPYSQLSDGTSKDFGAHYCLPAKGMWPLHELLDLLPADLPLSVEYHPRDPRYTAAQWATHVLEGTRRFLNAYHDASSAEQRSVDGRAPTP
jgi:sugar phosphate isomerase/epimerase